MDRRNFLKAAAAAPAVAATGPIILGAEDKAGSKRVTVGTGEHTYEWHGGFGELPPGVTWQTTHNVAVDAAGLVYISQQGHGKLEDTVFVFEPSGKFVRSFGKGWHGGGHGLDVRAEGGEEFVYLSNTSAHPKVVKATLKGEIVWSKERPAAKPYENPKAAYNPTNVAFAPDGGFFVGDGYGSSYVLKFDKDGNPAGVIGTPGSGPGQLKTPHGLWVDGRVAGKPVLVVCDRGNARLSTFTLDGEFLSATKPNDPVLHPCHIDIRGDVMLVPDLHARVTLLGKDNQVLAQLGDDAAWRKKVLAGKVRTQPKEWVDGKFVQPHDACFDKDGNIYVPEWVSTGRVTFLKKVG